MDSLLKRLKKCCLLADLKKKKKPTTAKSMTLCCFLAQIMSYGSFPSFAIQFYLCQASSHFVSYIRVYLPLTAWKIELISNP